jgi:hypothetical protein
VLTDLETSTHKTVLLPSGVVIIRQENVAKIDATTASSDQLDEAYDYLPDDAELVRIEYADGREVHHFEWGTNAPEMPAQRS